MNRLVFLFLSVVFINGFFSGCDSKVAEQSTDRENRPNVIILYTDDQGSVDMNVYGASDLHTPNMDKLANTGVRFTQFYAAASICSPSRAALMTGKTPLRAGVPGNISSRRGRDGMATEEITIAEVLKEQGYRTGHIGKWHLGYSESTMPNGQGFDYSFGHMGGCIDNYSHFFYWNGPNIHDLWENGREVWHDGIYFQDLMDDKALEFVEKNRDNPFFLYYAVNLPHYPLQGTEKWRKFYEDLPSPRKHYAACVSAVDERVGRLLDKLEALNLRENTIIIFQSDHGHSMEVRTMSGGGSAGPYRGSKFSFFEGGIRVPAMISWPANIPSGEIRDQMVFNVDWLPTILDLCSLKPLAHDIDGKSMKEIIYNNGANASHQSFYWTTTDQKRWAVRKDQWKLLKNPIDPTNKYPLNQEKDSVFLVNLDDDISEKNNLAAQHPDLVKSMSESFYEWFNAAEQGHGYESLK